MLYTGPVTISGDKEAKRRLSRDLIHSKTVNDREVKDIDMRFIVYGKVYDPFWTEVKNGARRLFAKPRFAFQHHDHRFVMLRGNRCRLTSVIQI